MPPGRPFLGDVELQQVQRIDVDVERVLARHEVPALEGDFLQDLGRRAARLALTGVLSGPDAGTALDKLRRKFHDAQPVDFTADLATATRVERVLIERMSVRELAGKPARYGCEFWLRQFTPGQPPTEEPPPAEPGPTPAVGTGTLEITVVVEGRPGFDFSRVTVTADRTAADGRVTSRTLTNRADAVWTEEGLEPAGYSVRAVVTAPEQMSGTATATVRSGERAAVTVTLRPGTVVATTFVVHFRFDSAFVEPCMRNVLRRAMDYAAAHPDERLVIVGHTDKTGPPDYNQALSERRGRSVVAMLIAGRDAPGARAEWSLLRRARTTGVNDGWGAEQYQHMLQDLGFYPGNVDGEHGRVTDAGVRAFRESAGLPAGSTVDDPTWDALIAAYLDRDALALAADRLLPNCTGSQLEWLGCGEDDPVRNTLDAWRPNRRVELLFVRTKSVPCPVPPPVTFELPAPDRTGRKWCLGPKGGSRCCFIKRGGRSTGWELVPAEPGTVDVHGSVTFQDGTPAAGVKYVLTAPDGEFLDGERPRGPLRGRPNEARTDAQGRFAYAGKPKGVYVLELHGEYLVRRMADPPEAARGNAVCFHLDDGKPDVVVVSTTGADLTQVRISPTLTLASRAVIVRKPHTNPARHVVTLGAAAGFTGSGTLTRSSTAVVLFTQLVGGSELKFDGTDNVFTGSQLSAGVTLFAEGARASAAVDDVVLQLALTPGGVPVAAPATARLTAVDLTLDVCQVRTAPGTDPVPLPAADKISVGRVVKLQSAGTQHERAMVIVRPPVPGGFAQDLVLTRVTGAVRAFAAEVPAPGQAPLADPHVVAVASIPAGGLRLFAEGAQVSGAVRDTGFRLGVKDVEPDGDRVAMTTIQFDVTLTAAPVTPTTFVRIGLWDRAFSDATGNLLNDAADGTNFISRDARPFFYVVRDPGAGAEVSVDWRTTKRNGTDDDRPPSPALNLTGAAGGPLLSKAVMLVTDQVDRDEPTNSGLPAAHPAAGLRTRAQSNHRVRQVTVDPANPLDGQAVASYVPAAGGPAVTTSVGLFSRAPEERRRIRIHLVNVRVSVGGAGILTPARRDLVQNAFRSIYARCGIFAEVDEIVLDPPAACIGWPVRYPTDPIAVDPSVEEFTLPGANLVPSASQTALVTAVRALPGFSASDIYVVCVARIFHAPIPAPPGPGLVFGNGGNAFPDSFTAAGAAARGFAFVGVASGITRLAEPHEATHITTDLRNAAGGHFDLGLPGAAVVAAGNIDGRNLMNRFFLPDGLGVRNPKRLWDTEFTNTNYAPALVLPRQVTTIRASRFIRPY